MNNCVAKKLDNPDEMNKFLETHILPKLTQKKKNIENLYFFMWPITHRLSRQK